MTITEGFVVEVARDLGIIEILPGVKIATRIWFMADPMVTDAYNAFDAAALRVGNIVSDRGKTNPMPRECCVYVSAAPKAMSPGDRIKVVGALVWWYPRPGRALTYGGAPVDFPADWHMAIERLPLEMHDPRGNQLLKVV